jgi:hypothetical protein
MAGGRFLRKCLVLLVVSCCLLGSVSPASADTPKNRGLLISPLRQYTNLDAGTAKTGTFTIANLTEGAITVNLSVKQFSVSDYAYNYSFNTPNDWLKLAVTDVHLQANESRAVSYSITVPKGTAAGGQYYTLIASADLGTGGLNSTVQAATLLYITINGKLIRTSELIGNSVQRVVFGKQIRYTINVKNTGNVHYFAYFSGQLHGFLPGKGTTGTSHILLPGAIRQVSDDIPSPLLPGIYKATYGYRTDAGTSVQKSSYILFIPPWSLAFVAVLLLAFLNFKSHKKPKTQKTEPEPDTPPSE